MAGLVYDMFSLLKNGRLENYVYIIDTKAHLRYNYCIKKLKEI